MFNWKPDGLRGPEAGSIANVLSWVTLRAYPEHQGDTGEYLWSVVVTGAQGSTCIASARRNGTSSPSLDGAQRAAEGWWRAQIAILAGQPPF